MDGHPTKLQTIGFFAAVMVVLNLAFQYGFWTEPG